MMKCYLAALLAPISWVGGADFWQLSLPAEDRLAIQPPEWGWFDKSIEHAQELTSADGLFFSDISNRTAILFPRTDTGVKQVPPFKVITSPMRGAKASAQLEYVNATVLGGIKNPNLGQQLLPHFDLVDLFGCVPNADFYRLIHMLDSQGTLVLPYPGIDFGKITRLPPRIQCLVIYNSMVPPHLDELLEPLMDLQEIVFIGCYAERFLPKEFYTDTPNSGLIHFAKVAPRVKRISLLRCSETLVSSVGWGMWPALEELETTHYHVFKYKYAKYMRSASPNVFKAMQPDTPKLRKVVYFLSATDSKSDTLSVRMNELIQAFRDESGRPELEVECIRSE